MIQQIIVDSIDYRYSDSSPKLFNDYSTILRFPAIHAILGRSGSGKSTFIKLLSGLLLPQKGSINLLFEQDSPFKSSYYDLGHQTFLQTQSCLVSQFIEYENFSVQEYIKFGSTNQSGVYSKINSSLSIFDANFRLDENFLRMNMNQLSGGQRKMLSLAKIMLINRPVLLLDEPTSGVDAESKIKIYYALTRIATEKLVIFSTHDNSYIELPSRDKFKEITLN